MAKPSNKQSTVPSSNFMTGIPDKTRNDPYERKSFLINPNQMSYWLGRPARPSIISWRTLRNMGQRSHTVSAIIQLRSNQVASFCKRPRFRGDQGFVVSLKQEDRKPTDKERQEMYLIEEFLLNTGWGYNPDRTDTFESYIRKLVRDRLTLDAACTELVYDQAGRLSEIWAVDGATVEFVMPDLYIPETPLGEELPIGNIKYVQVIEGDIKAEFSGDELIYAVSNPRTDITSFGYGLSELELLIEIITAELYARTYNRQYFSQNTLPPGILSITGKFKEEHLEELRRMWSIYFDGTNGAFRVPIIGLEDGQGVNFIPFHQSNRDMEFSSWLQFLTTVICSVYLVDPLELGFKFDSSGINPSDGDASRLLTSRDKGLKPLLQFLSNMVSRNIINRVNPKYKFDWVGVDPEDDEKRINIQKAELEMGKKTINEVRTSEDLPEFSQEWANMPINPSILNYLQQQLVMQQEQDMTAGNGDAEGKGLEGQGKSRPKKPPQKPEDQGNHGKESQGVKLSSEQEISGGTKTKGASDVQKSLTQEYEFQIEIEV